MGSLILPSRFNRQPAQAAPIDRANPISFGLAGAWIPPNIAAKAVNGATTGATSVGLGFLTTTTAYWQASANAVISQSPTWTILAMVSGAQAGVGNGFPLYCERPNATQLVKLQIGLGATSTANIVVRDAGGVGLVNISGTTDVRTMTGIRTIVGTRRSLSDHRLFVNGTQEGASAVNPGSSFADTSATLGYDMQDAGAALTTAALPIVLVWNRSLSDAEIAEVSRNPWQVFKAPTRRVWVASAGGGVGNSVSPATGNVSIVGLAPVVTQTANQSLAPNAGSMTLTGYAPSVVRTANTSASPGNGALVLSGYAPTISQAVNVAISPLVGSLSITGYAPSVARTVSTSISLNSGVLALAGYAPTIAQTASSSLSPASGQVALTGYAPSVMQTAPIVTLKYRFISLKRDYNTDTIHFSG